MYCIKYSIKLIFYQQLTNKFALFLAANTLKRIDISHCLLFDLAGKLACTFTHILSSVYSSLRANGLELPCKHNVAPPI